MGFSNLTIPCSMNTNFDTRHEWKWRLNKTVGLCTKYQKLRKLAKKAVVTAKTAQTKEGFMPTARRKYWNAVCQLKCKTRLLSALTDQFSKVWAMTGGKANALSAQFAMHF